MAPPSLSSSSSSVEDGLVPRSGLANHGVKPPPPSEDTASPPPQAKATMPQNSTFSAVGTPSFTTNSPPSADNKQEAEGTADKQFSAAGIAQKPPESSFQRRRPRLASEPQATAKLAVPVLPPLHNTMSVTSTSTPATGDPETQAKKKKPRRHVSGSRNDNQSTGRWTDEEHQAFLRGLHTYGREWKKVAAHIPTRTSAQVRSHAQKYFAKLQKEEEAWVMTYPSVGGGVTSATPNDAMAMMVAGGGVIQSAGGTPAMSSSIQANVARIMAHPERVEAEVQDTLEQLRQRYAALQRRLEQTATAHQHGKRSSAATGAAANIVPPPLHDDNQEVSSIASLSAASLQNEERIALDVLRGGLPNGDAGSNSGRSSGSGSHNHTATGGHRSREADAGEKGTHQQEEDKAKNENAMVPLPLPSETMPDPPVPKKARCE